MPAKKALSIGITFNPATPDAYGIWGYDITRYCCQLIKLLSEIGHRVKLITPNSNDNLKAIDSDKFNHFGIEDYLKNSQKLDFIIEFSASIRHSLLKSLKDKSAAKLIAIRYGNIQIEDISGLFIRQHLDTDIHHQMADDVWLVGDCPDCNQYLQYLYHMPIQTAPLLWEPEQGVESLTANPAIPLNIVVVEKNNSVVSNLLGAANIVHGIAIADENAFQSALFFNSITVHNHKYFLENIVNNLDYLQSNKNKVWFIDGISLSKVFQNRSIVIGYQHRGPINLYYLEAIARNIPVVHNCPLMIEVGYFYPEFDFKAGVEKAIRAIRDYDPAEWETHNRCFLRKFSVRNKENQEHYKKLLKKASEKMN